MYERARASDRTSSIGRFDKALAKGWTVVSMQHNWETIFPPDVDWYVGHWPSLRPVYELRTALRVDIIRP